MCGCWLPKPAVYHLAALRADPEAAHLVEPTNKVLSELLTAYAAQETAEQDELNHQALFTRKDFDLDALTGRDQEAATLELVTVLRARFGELAERHASQLEALAKAAAEAEQAWRSAERIAASWLVTKRTLTTTPPSNRRAVGSCQARRLPNHRQYGRCRGPGDQRHFGHTELCKG
jgi:hypothetical protein